MYLTCAFIIQNPLDQVLFYLYADSTAVFVHSMISASSLLNDVLTLHTIQFGKKTALASYDSFQGLLSSLRFGRGAYIDISSGSIANCLVSVGIRSPVCLRCSNGYVLQNNTCVSGATCSAGYFTNTNSTQCSPCPDTCLTCVYVSGSPSYVNCLSCPADYPVLYVSVTTQSYCLQQCPTGTTKDDNNHCICDSSCATCDFLSYPYSVKCSPCPANTYLVGSVCVSSVMCNFNTYGSSGVCSSTCPGGQKKDFTNRLCVASCAVGQYLYLSTCYTVCPTGTYPSGAACLACTNNCAACTSATFCTQCLTNFLLHEKSGKCLASCETG